MLKFCAPCYMHWNVWTGYCDEPVAPASGSVNSTGNLEGDTVTYSCIERCILIGDANRTCQPDGNWSGIQPECKRMFILIYARQCECVKCSRRKCGHFAFCYHWYLHTNGFISCFINPSVLHQPPVLIMVLSHLSLTEVSKIVYICTGETNWA